MNPPIIWILHPSSGWKTFCKITTRPSCSSRTTGCFCKKSPHALWKLTGENYSPFPATSRLISQDGRPCMRLKKKSGKPSIKNWLRKKSGFGRASRQGERATRDVCERFWPCGRSDHAGVSGTGTLSLPFRRPSAAAGWWPTPKKSVLPMRIKRSSIRFPHAYCAVIGSALSDLMAPVRPLFSRSYWEICPYQAERSNSAGHQGKANAQRGTCASASGHAGGAITQA